MTGGPGGSPANSPKERPGWSLMAHRGALGLDRAQVKEAVVGFCPMGSFPQDEAEIPNCLL